MTQPDDFFIGWDGRTGPRLGRFLILVVAGALSILALLAVSLSAAVSDPGDGGFDWAAGQQTLRGMVTTAPYPLLFVPPDAAHQEGHTVLLSGEGKNGAPLASGSDGRLVEATGIMIRRGDIDMLQLGDAPKLLADQPGVKIPEAQKLGRWRIVGEICDGKCYTGAMRPGSGLAHRACASLCLFGGIPPVLVSTAPVAGSPFLLLADPDGHALSDLVRNDVAVRLAMEGDVERRGDVLIFRTAISAARHP